ncbi:NnrS family protein [Streptomyces sp. HUAS TT20]|uniref:NnrS family protein n=1 Tax=Streptomyces sp. HUAS TT20 TaxID=3447509 RepID=UPI0021DA78BE|nr:NnrS family protein [Streptomyces sp. HUAS 15-9]UXY32223.1 NnrS family protein [Streptomyces sp. HUAS 15-9]
MPVELSTTGPPCPPKYRNTVHAPFFTAAVLSVLTVGASWGVLILWRIGFDERFTGVSVHEINAHGYAQITGWVGLFVMGFGYQAFPRLWRTSLAAPRLVPVVLAAAVTGLVTAVIGMGAAGYRAGGGWTVPVALVGNALVLVASLLFAGQLLVTYRRSGGPLRPVTGFIGSGVFWIVGQAAFGLWHTAMTMTAAARSDLLWYIATYQAPLRDMQIHGMALLMILGLSSHLLPQMFGVARTPERRAWTALLLINAGVVTEVVVFVAYRWTGAHWAAALLMLPWLMIAGGVAVMALPWRLWRRLPRNDHRSGKFVRAAYGWLALSLVMLLLMPVYQSVTGLAFSHAYYGAIRHAITVGFASMMITGIAARVAPTLRGIHPRTLGSLTGPFVLLNTGCALRVILQTLTDWHPFFFSVVGISGLLELTALAWWGTGLLRIIHGPTVPGAGGYAPGVPRPAPGAV